VRELKWYKFISILEKKLDLISNGGKNGFEQKDYSEHKFFEYGLLKKHF